MINEIPKKPLDEDLKQLLDDLWNNWAFRLSLSSNELFHSNILQYLAELLSKTTSSDGGVPDEPKIGEPPNNSKLAADFNRPTTISYEAARKLFTLLTNDKTTSDDPFLRFKKEQLDGYLTVKREWNEMDLAILWQQTQPHGKTFLPLFAMEVKVKSYPTKDQLDGYTGKLIKVWGDHHEKTFARKKKANSPAGQAVTTTFVPPLFLLTGMGATVPKNHQVSTLHFGNLHERLTSLSRQFQALAPGNPVPETYTSLCTQLHQLFDYLHEQLIDTLNVEQAMKLRDDLKPYRLHAIWGKLWAADLARRCEKSIRTKVEATPTLGADVDEYLVTDSGYTRGGGSLNVVWKAVWKELSEGKDKKLAGSISIGVQLEGNSIRFLLNITHDSVGKKAECRKEVERVLLALCANFGVFEKNPSLPLHAAKWGQQLKRYSNGIPTKASAWAGLPLPNSISHPLFRTASKNKSGKLKVGSGRKEGDFVPLLHGFANGNGNGHADFRLTLNDDVTIEEIVDLISDVLVGDLYCNPQAATSPRIPLLLQVVKAFKDSKDRSNWVAAPYVP